MKSALVLAVALAACGDDAPAIDAAPDAPASAWRLGPTMPVRRLEPGVAALGTTVVVLGGFDTSLGEGLDITKRVDQFDTLTEAWGDPLPDAPVAWTHIQLATVGANLYLLGGLEGAQYMARGEAWTLDASSHAWVARASMPAGQERGAAAVVVSNGHVFLLGGAGTTDALATCLDYEIATDSWTQLPDLPAPRSHPAAMRMSDGTLIVAGGLHTLDATEPLGDVLALPLGANAWVPRTGALATPRGGCVYGVLQGQLVCAGGEAGAAALHVVESYDPLTDVWTPVERMPGERAGTQGAVVGQRLYLAGGAQELAFIPTDSFYIYSPLDTAP